MIYENWIEVVDDDLEIRKMLTTILQVHGFGVRTHDGGQTYLSAPPLNARRVMLLDVRMPQMTGIELQAIMIKRGDKTPVIFMSGESLLHEQLAAQRSNAIHFLWKPFKTEDLLIAIQEGLKSWSG